MRPDREEEEENDCQMEETAAPRKGTLDRSPFRFGSDVRLSLTSLKPLAFPPFLPASRPRRMSAFLHRAANTDSGENQTPIDDPLFLPPLLFTRGPFSFSLIPLYLCQHLVNAITARRECASRGLEVESSLGCLLLVCGLINA